MREEYKQYERIVAAIQKDFEDAYTRGDSCFFSNTPNLAERMASVVAFDFDESDIADLTHDYYFDERKRESFLLGLDENEHDENECDENEHEPITTDMAWDITTGDMQVAVYRWLQKLEMPKGALSKFKVDAKRNLIIDWESPIWFGGCNRKSIRIRAVGYGYTPRDYFRRLVSIARMAGAAHVGTADDLLNANAAKYVKDYKPDVSFHFRCADVEGVTVNIQAFSIGNIRPARLLLEKERYKDGWCYVENWTRPNLKKCRDEERMFFSHIESKTDSVVGAAGDKYYFRIAPKEVKRGYGGARAGAGRKPQTK